MLTKWNECEHRARITCLYYHYVKRTFIGWFALGRINDAGNFRQSTGSVLNLVHPYQLRSA